MHNCIAINLVNKSSLITMRLIEKVWFHSHPAKYYLIPLLLPFTLLFWLISAIRRGCYSLGLLTQVNLTVPVIVVGNISVGGNGKTPVVLWLIDQCQLLGLTVGVISRGYGGKAAQYPLILNNETTTAQAGDEPVMIYQRSKVAIAVGGDRVASAKQLIKQGCNIIISDDGLQHYRLGRAVELAIVDGQRGFGNGLLMPAGPLREALWRLTTVDHVIVNGDSRINHLQALKAIKMNLTATYVVNVCSGEQVDVKAFTEQNSQVNAIAGIGAPQRFFDTLNRYKIKLAQQQAFADHYHFQAQDLAHFANDMPLLMTEKDAVKCHGFAEKNWWYLRVDAQFNAEQVADLLTQITALTQVKNKLTDNR
jgi:tetraacyldisaccharide 4'-kinase